MLRRWLNLTNKIVQIANDLEADLHFNQRLTVKKQSENEFN